MNTMQVSIVITSYNRINDLKETLIRVKDINYPHIEIIIVDNGSNDGSAEFVESLPDADFRKIIIKPNKGSAYSHMQGMLMARGDIVITIDDDCFLRPSVVKKTVEVFKKNKNLAGIGYGFVNPNVGFNEESYQKSTIFKVNNNQFENSYESIVATSGAAFRKSALEKIGYYDLSWFYVTEDVELCFDLIAHGYNTVTIPELVAYHKSSPVNRDLDHITFQGVRGTVWLILKYFPKISIPFRLLRFIFYCLYYTFLNRKLIYIRALYASIIKAHLMIINDKRLSSKIYNKLIIPEIQSFSR